MRVYWLLLPVLAMACNGGTTDSGPDTTPPSANVDPADGSVLTGQRAIVITFDETMDTSSLVLGGSLAEDSSGGAWSQTSRPDDTLTVAPATSWAVGPDQTLTVDATDLASNALDTLELTYGCAVVYVSVDDPDASDTNAGTPTAPLKHLDAAVAKGNLDFPSTDWQLLVAGGTYNVNSSATPSSAVSLSGGTQMLGGYASDWSERDPSLYPTVIADQGTSTTNTNAPLQAGDSSLVDGFTLRGGGGNWSVGVQIWNGTPTIQHNIIEAGTGSGHTTGILGGGATIAPIVVGNVIHGGGGGEISEGLQVTTAVIRNNEIFGGTGNICRGILSNTGSVIQNNTVTCDGTGTSEALVLTLGGNAIENNILFTGPTGGTRHCMAESNANADPLSFANNDLFDCGDALYVDEGNTARTSVADLNDPDTTTQGAAPSGNVSIDPSFVSQAGGDFHFQPGGTSPCAVTEGGLDLSADVPTDLDGKSRTDPLSMGAYEHDAADGGCTN